MDTCSGIPLPFLLVAAGRSGFTGRLVLIEAEVERVVFLHAGQPVHVQSRLQEETLGYILMQEGRLTQAQYIQLLEKLATTCLPAGESLVSMGILGPQEVFSALEFQARKKLINSFKMADLSYRLEEGPVPAQFLIAKLDMSEVILSGIQSAYTVDRLLSEFPVDEDSEFVATGKPASGLGPRESKILRQIKTATNLATLLKEGRDLRDLLCILYALYALDLLEVSDLARPHVPGFKKAESPPLPAPPIPVARPASPRPPASEPGRPAVASGQAATAAPDKDQDISPTLAAKILAMTRQNHFQFLEVDPSDRGYALQNAYYRLLREFQLQDIEQAYATCKERELAGRLLDHATMAFQVLSDDTEREAYQKALKARKAPGEASPRVRADVEAQKGRLALSAKRYGEALDLFQAAVKMCPDEPSYHFQIGKTLYLQALDQLPADKPIPDGVRKPLLKAQALDPHYDDPRLYQGYISKRNGDAKRALKEFKGALECNPNNKLAQSEVRLLKRRLGET